MTVAFCTRVMSGATKSRLHSTRWSRRVFAMVCALVIERIGWRETTSGSFRPSRRRLRWLAGFAHRCRLAFASATSARARSLEPDNGRTQVADLCLGLFALVLLQDEFALKFADTPCQACQSRVSHATSTAASATMKVRTLRKVHFRCAISSIAPVITNLHQLDGLDRFRGQSDIVKPLWISRK
jgi:hypothetical protein